VTVTYEFDNGVAVLTLDRPEKLNAVTTAMSERLSCDIRT
jgi:enoyl-CoA hydratase/carnithine racemase